MEILRSGEWIESLKCFTADIVKGTGGKIIEYKRCRIARRDTLMESGAITGSRTGVIKSAAHNYHFTINLELENGALRKIHPILVYQIDNCPVI